MTVSRIRFGVVVALFLISSLVVLPAPTSLAWMLEVIAAERGVWFAVATLFAAFFPWSARGRLPHWAMLLGSLACVFFVTPSIGGWWMQRSLKNRLTMAFGATAERKPTYTVQTTTITYVRPRPGSDAMEMDISYPTRTTRAPCVLVIHGGSWARGTRRDLPELNQYLATRGYVVATMSYRLAPTHPFPAARDDVDSAMAFLRRNATTFGIDTMRFVLLGRSAGGQLALLEAYRSPHPSVRGVVAFYAPTDLRFGYANPSNPLVLDSRAALRRYLGGSPEEVGAQYDSASPMTYAQRSSVPTLLIHGARDELVTVRHSERLAEVLKGLGESVVFLRLPWATHGCDYVFDGPCGTLTRRAVEQFVSAVTGEL